MYSDLHMTYLSSGNIPSASANSMQVMKMAQALASHVDRFELIVEGDIRRNDFNLWDWYGISHPFKIISLKTQWRRKLPLPRDYRSRRFFVAATLWAFLRSPSLVYTRIPKLAQLCWSLRIPAVLESHSKPQQRWIPLWERHFRGLVTISDLLADEYKKWGYPDNKIWVFPDGVDLDQIMKAAANLQKSSLPPLYRMHTVYTGHLYPNRGIDMILAAAEKMPDTHFHLLGGWEKDVEHWRKIVWQKSLMNVEVLGFVPNKALSAYLLSADVLLMPYSQSLDTRQWMSPLKMFEYMAAGRCIVASDLPRVKEVLTHEKTALLFEADNLESFVSTLHRAAASETLRQTLGEAARRKVTPYTWNNRAQEILKQVVAA